MKKVEISTYNVSPFVATLSGLLSMMPHGVELNLKIVERSRSEAGNKALSREAKHKTQHNLRGFVVNLHNAMKGNQNGSGSWESDL